jgi:hypothetical protein
MGKTMKFYHGTTRENARDILENGFELNARGFHQNSGTGVYFYAEEDLCKADWGQFGHKGDIAIVEWDILDAELPRNFLGGKCDLGEEMQLGYLPEDSVEDLEEYCDDRGMGIDENDNIDLDKCVESYFDTAKGIASIEMKDGCGIANGTIYNKWDYTEEHEVVVYDLELLKKGNLRIFKEM